MRKGCGLKAVIFLGPTLLIEEARQILEAVYLPPAQQCDLVNAVVNERPDVIGLIDGVFMQSLSVWHKEILYALDQGLRVYGSSSMGALRAAETSAFGMVGVGKVYGMYASGEMIDDEEVALSHAAPEQNYHKTSEPMVNVRATFQAAHAAGVLDEAQLDLITKIAKKIYFAERTFRAIFAAAASEGLPQFVIERLSAFVATNYVDLKRQDAIELLHTIKRLEINGAKPRVNFQFKRSTAFETLYNRDRQVQQGKSRLHQEAISNYVALHNPEFHDLNFNALNRIVVLAFAEVLGLEAPKEAVDAESTRFRTRRSLAEDDEFSSWLTANHINLDDFRALMGQVVLCRRMHRWFMIAMWMERTSKVILDELRLKNEYAEWVARAAAQDRLLRSNGCQTRLNGTHLSLKELVAEHQDWSDSPIDIDPEEWAQEAGFHTMGNLKMELLRASEARRALLELLADSTDGEPESVPAAAYPPEPVQE
jgi:hypothetical protein